MNNINVQYRFWFCVDGQPLFGHGKLKLLQEIDKTKSIRKAAANLKMSYRKAYYSIDQINRLSEKPVILMKRGGKNGGSSQLTYYGKQLIEKYIQLDKEINRFLLEKTTNL